MEKGWEIDGQKIEAHQEIDRAIASSPSLRNKGDPIADFVASVSMDGDVRWQWRQFTQAPRESELAQIIAEGNLDAKLAREFMAGAFRDGSIPATGVAITRILPPASKFSPDGAHAAKKRTVLERLQAFFDRYFDLN